MEIWIRFSKIIPIGRREQLTAEQPEMTSPGTSLYSMGINPH